MTYPVEGRSQLRNQRIAVHEIGHAFVARALGKTVHSVSIVPSYGYEGRCIRSGPSSDLVFEDEWPAKQTDTIISVCDRLAKMAPELGSARLDDAEYILRGQSMVIELLAGAAAEEVLFPSQPISEPNTTK